MAASKSRRIGMGGLGNMGLPMAESLLRAGYEVTGFSLTGMERFVAAGGVAARSARTVPRSSTRGVRSG